MHSATVLCARHSTSHIMLMQHQFKIVTKSGPLTPRLLSRMAPVAVEPARLLTSVYTMRHTRGYAAHPGLDCVSSRARGSAGGGLRSEADTRGELLEGREVAAVEAQPPRHAWLLKVGETHHERGSGEKFQKNRIEF